MSAVLGVIPARLGSERLPRKPLHPIAGRPLIEWVWLRARALEILDALVVATDSEEVAAVCRAAGADAVMTDPGHASGTDRVAEVAAREAYAGHDVIVNVQGDEPFVTEEQVAGAVGRVLDGWDVGTVAAPVGSLQAWRDPAVVKVVRNGAGGALYFSRAPIPHRRAGEPGGSDLASDRYLRHIGVYAYTPEALARWVRLPPSVLERTERLEQLRALEAGLGIGVAVVAAAEGGEGGIDTLEDARRAEERLRATGAVK
ncbi:MAG: 3-deoxy-manno-octulosonate cytidylyltransferase [Gemmatimonadetes bacterium]|nr:3-deoxy-manno-octulosonate cytidylyltransferase [Gemmatimonadota bacterium]NIQ57435.1 3-deoxy-manno-octulosonate cytidylyltransferase [Gemmatimonadota bacterium]NIU79118.1 3-deoxy-manno-octulosonate cytidylyltransferase [Gammaproteobacteria bacterium]NIX46786.1 3-deoxy-manno-octulosonate cytidylyltransferase [Gemmatimonadota bacterium]NIY11140.1 3-deoxy-manno-octulosonate cytidylyltransferase [Gemmatimonadota bacterium]